MATSVFMPDFLRRHRGQVSRVQVRPAGMTPRVESLGLLPLVYAATGWAVNQAFKWGDPFTGSEFAKYRDEQVKLLTELADLEDVVMEVGTAEDVEEWDRHVELLNSRTEDIKVWFEWDCNPCGAYFGRSKEQEQRLQLAYEQYMRILRDFVAWAKRVKARGGQNPTDSSAPEFQEAGQTAADSAQTSNPFLQSSSPRPLRRPTASDVFRAARGGGLVVHQDSSEEVPKAPVGDETDTGDEEASKFPWLAVGVGVGALALIGLVVFMGRRRRRPQGVAGWRGGRRRRR